MILKDFNQTLVLPADYEFHGAEGEGSFAVLEFSQKQFDTLDGLKFLERTNWIRIWVNDQGREVFRTGTVVPAPPTCPKCGDTATRKGGHGPYCLSPTCKWGWEVEEDGSPLRPPVVPPPVIPYPWYFVCVDAILSFFHLD